jgi:uncharacterized membrane protein
MGLFFRITNLDLKPIWSGEAYTFSVVSGYFDSESIERVTTVGLSICKKIDVKSFLTERYHGSDKNLGDIFQKLYIDNQPPLYFVLAHYWVKLFGYSLATLRSLSAVLSVMAIPSIYWFCLELFGVPLVGWVGSALLSVSPIQVIYAQEAGSFSLLSLVVLLSGSALLWALRTHKQIAWLIYTVSLIIGLYSQYSFIFVVLGYLIYVLSIESFRFTKKLQCFCLTTLLGFTAFLPWIAIVFRHLSGFKVAAVWPPHNNLTFLGAIALWAENISLSFIDLVDPKASEYGGFGKFCFYSLTPCILILVGYSIYLLCSKTPRKVYLSILISIGATTLPLIIIDLILAENQQIWPRNLYPLFLNMQISVAYLLSSKNLFSDIEKRNWYSKCWSPIAAVIITAEIVFCSVILQADTWWNKYGGQDTLSFTQIIDQSKDPLLVVNRQDPKNVIFYNLKPKVRLLFSEDCQLKVDIFQGDNDIFLLNPSIDVQGELKLDHYQLDLLAQFPNLDRVYDLSTPPQLWKVRKSIP